MSHLTRIVRLWPAAYSSPVITTKTSLLLKAQLRFCFSLLVLVHRYATFHRLRQWVRDQAAKKEDAACTKIAHTCIKHTYPQKQHIYQCVIEHLPGTFVHVISSLMWLNAAHEKKRETSSFCNRRTTIAQLASYYLASFDYMKADRLHASCSA